MFAFTTRTRMKESIIGILTLMLLRHGSAQDPTVDIPGLGSVVGATDLSYVNERPFSMFLNVPFATPPVGPTFRFKAAAPVQPWSGVWNATFEGNRCPQVTVDRNNTNNTFDYTKASVTEDCLYLKIYTPTPVEGANLPVVVFLHGGAYVTGSKVLYDGHKFMDYDVVLVVPNYRLGPFGFLSLDTDDIPGNAGLIDQAMAIQWVKDYISSFGGDPNRITVMGHSAGGNGASLHNISPLSSNLFQQLIIQSGAASAIWGLDYNNIYAATEIGNLYGCPELDIQGLTTCFLNADVLQLLRAQSDFQSNELAAGRNIFSGASPVIQKAGSVIFLDRDPREILQSGNHTAHRMLLGSNKHEGTLPFSYIHNGYLVKNGLLDNQEYMQREYTNFILHYLRFQDQGESIAAMTEKSHFGQSNMGNYTAMTSGIVDYLGNGFFKGPVYEDAMYNYAIADTYLYAFHYLGDRSLFYLFADPNAIDGGVCHGNELLLQFNIPGPPLTIRDRRMSRTLMELWTNFIIYSNPTPPANPVDDVPNWPLFNGSTRSGKYMIINENCTVQSDHTLNEYFLAETEGFPYLTDP
ncbi:hypothetical protein B566_EDAN003022 [Ephemera danica]|nr:hypothetical protein B566_EDAN003022 [Ephemera danica]